MRTYIIIGIALIVVVGIIAFVFASKNGPVQGPVDTSGNVSTVHPADASGFPTGPSVTIGTPHGAVTVSNFYKLVTEQEEDSLLIRKTESYLISYDTTDSSFWIFVTAGPVDAVRAAAEKDLLSILGVSQQQACMLKASLTVDPSLSGGTYPLSFCPQNVQ